MSLSPLRIAISSRYCSVLLKFLWMSTRAQDENCKRHVVVLGRERDVTPFRGRRRRQTWRTLGEGEHEGSRRVVTLFTPLCGDFRFPVEILVHGVNRECMAMTRREMAELGRNSTLNRPTSEDHSDETSRLANHLNTTSHLET